MLPRAVRVAGRVLRESLAVIDAVNGAPAEIVVPCYSLVLIGLLSTLYWLRWGTWT